jgi:general secretion pathway protein M
LAGIQSALSKLAAVTPSVFVDSLSMQTIGAVRPASIQRLGAQVNLYALRVRP